jgi:hypothetical protein
MQRYSTWLVGGAALLTLGATSFAGCTDSKCGSGAGKCVIAGTGGSGTGGGGGVGGGSATGGGGGAGGVGGGGGTTATLPAALVQDALAFAAAYTAWGRVDDELRWAPDLCRIPYPGIVRQSGSDDPATHGQKLYSVFAKNHAAYPRGPHTGQVIVKQSWKAELVSGNGTEAGFNPGSYRSDGGIESDHFYPYATKDGAVYRASEPAGLYLMWKVEPATDDSDEGWIYATITTAGQVTAAGRVSSCMGCHEMADHERLFGVPLSPSIR